MGIFEPALSRLLERSRAVFPPASFKDYLSEHGFSKPDTASKISIDAYELLDSELRMHDTMVFRLGSARGTGTQFALARVEGRLRDFFLFDDEVFTAPSASTFTPENQHQLLAFKLLPDLTETSLVNLGLASGLITSALGVDPEDTFLLPATGRSTVSFSLQLHSTIPEIFTHNRGQVEIDSLFTMRRKGQDTLFIIEAKGNNAPGSLSKHKLVYPILAVARNVPSEVPIVPVYLKVLKSDQGYHYHIVECSFPDPRLRHHGIDELKAVKHTQIILPFENLPKKIRS